MKKQIIKITVTAIICILTIGCASKDPYLRDFDLVHKDYKIEKNSIAIIPGYLEDSNILLADLLTKELKKKAYFNVIDFKKVYKHVPRDRHIIGEWGRPPTNDKKKLIYWFSPENKKSVASIQAKLKSKYIFVVWSGNSGSTTVSGSGYSSTGYYYSVTGRLLEYPSNEVIGYTINGYSKDAGIIGSSPFGSSAKNFERLVQKSVEIISNAIISKTKK